MTLTLFSYSLIAANPISQLMKNNKLCIISYLSSSFCQLLTLTDNNHLHDCSVNELTVITIRCLYCTFLLTILILIMYIYHELINPGRLSKHNIICTCRVQSYHCPNAIYTNSEQSLKYFRLKNKTKN